MTTAVSEQAGCPNSITALLVQLSAGNREVEAELITQVYGELHRLAARYMRAERGDHTLQPTALVNEAYTRLVQQPPLPWQSRVHFFATASHIMRHILVDCARKRRAAKRGGAQRRISVSHAELRTEDHTIDVLVLSDALERLAELDSRQARIVELHFFASLSFIEIAQFLEVSERTVKRDWSMARAWLKSELSKER
jgi:RNA polymerase sigma factor (TIGR02999 family)